MTAPARVRYRCPNCGEALHPSGDRGVGADDGGLACHTGHRFDRAAEGYVHLLPAGRKRGGPAGDSSEMLSARRAFLDAGHYEPVIAAVTGAVPTDATAVLDAGCGEGTYLAAVAAPERHGVDIAKPGIRLAARRHRDASFAVASSYRLPYFDDTFDAVLSVFAPRPFDEFARVLRPGGIVVVASPGPDHLASLRDLLYDDSRDGDDAAPHDPTTAERVRFDLPVQRPHVRALLQMTPHWWRATPARRDEVAELDQIETTIDIWVTTHLRS